MSDVFISYASEDRTRVQPIVEQLQDQGWSVWWDRDIAVGAGFEQTIDEQIQAARCVVVAWSERSVSSRWVRNEALEVRERDILIPLMLDEVRVPVAFRQSQSIDFSGQLHFDRAMQALLGAIAGMTATGTTLPETIAAPPASDKPSIAVLPFRSHAPDEREEFIITCLAEDLGANLAQLPGFFVISPRTTAAFAGRAIDPVDVGRQLRVRYVVDGSLRRAGEQLLVAAQLTDATTGMQLYAERIESSAAELDELNDELVRGLVSCIEPELMRAEVKRISSRPIEHLDAWSLCRKGIGVLQTRGWHEDVLSETACGTALSRRQNGGSRLRMTIHRYWGMQVARLPTGAKWSAACRCWISQFDGIRATRRHGWPAPWPGVTRETCNAHWMRHARDCP
jgi:TolB-like protein